MRILLLVVFALFFMGCAQRPTPVDPSQELAAGVARVHAAEYRQALDHLQRALEEFPDDPETNYALGFAYMELDKPELALVHFTRVLVAGEEQDELVVKAFVARGYVLHSLERFDAAVESYGAALGRSPDNIHALYNRGCAYGRMGDYDKAIRDFIHVLSLSPDHAEARDNLRHYSAKLSLVGRIRPTGIHSRFQRNE